MENEELDSQKKPELEVETKQKLGLGVKVMLTVVVLGAVAAGVYLAMTLAK